MFQTFSTIPFNNPFNFQSTSKQTNFFEFKQSEKEPQFSFNNVKDTPSNNSFGDWNNVNKQNNDLFTSNSFDFQFSPFSNQSFHSENSSTVAYNFNPFNSQAEKKSNNNSDPFNTTHNTSFSTTFNNPFNFQSTSNQTTSFSTDFGFKQSEKEPQFNNVKDSAFGDWNNVNKNTTSQNNDLFTSKPFDFQFSPFSDQSFQPNNSLSTISFELQVDKKSENNTSDLFNSSFLSNSFEKQFSFDDKSNKKDDTFKMNTFHTIGEFNWGQTTEEKKQDNLFQQPVVKNPTMNSFQHEFKPLVVEQQINEKVTIPKINSNPYGTHEVFSLSEPAEKDVPSMNKQLEKAPIIQKPVIIPHHVNRLLTRKPLRNKLLEKKPLKNKLLENMVDETNRHNEELFVLRRPAKQLIIIEEESSGKPKQQLNELPKEVLSNKLAPKLTKPGYITIPSIEELKKNFSNVRDFTIIRKNFGEIKFLGTTNLCGLDLDKIVDIGEKYVEVYSNTQEENKPPKGHGLNKPAEIKLFNIYPKDKSKIQRFKEKLIRHTKKMGGTFLHYENGEWMFRVEHF